MQIIAYAHEQMLHHTSARAHDLHVEAKCGRAMLCSSFRLSASASAAGESTPVGELEPDEDADVMTPDVEDDEDDEPEGDESAPTVEEDDEEASSRQSSSFCISNKSR